MKTLALLLLLALPQEKRIPAPGVPVPDADRAELEAGVKQLASEIDTLRLRHPDLVPDVAIYHKAVRYALAHNEFLVAKEIPTGKELLKHGLERARQLRDGKPAWTEATGLVVRGYGSRIDDSVQPYGLVIPTSWKPGIDRKFRLDFWLHGRAENLTELNFIAGRQRSPGEFTPPDTFVLHLYGRYCNASKFAGEVDLFEALESVKSRYPIDENRLVVRGFSMGGASTWHIAAHYAGLWAAAAPGAGFAETPVYANVYKDPVKPTKWQETLWHWYNATDFAGNLFNCPVVAYSGELDKQKQAADIMAAAMKAEGLDLVHVIGPKTEHKYEPEAKKEVSRLIDAHAAKGRAVNPDAIRFTTWTLRYNTMKWVTVEGMEKHWQRARVEAYREKMFASIKTENVSALSITAPFEGAVIDGQKVLGTSFKKVDGKWTAGTLDDPLRKRHGLQGPIDDAFMDRFVFVTPTGKPLNETLGAWVAAEQAKAIEVWRRFFRGDARVIKDDALTNEEIASSHLVLWGDPSSNKVLAKIADKLPVKWDSDKLALGSATHAGSTHVPLLVYPNPLNPKRYVVLNSGFTFADQTALSNSRHVPMLPDWAIVDVTKKGPDRVVAADFFGERWEVR